MTSLYSETLELLEKLYDDEDMEDLEVIESNEIRSQMWEHTVFDWACHVRQLMHEDRFEKEYRMTIETFEISRELLHSKLERNSLRNGSRRTVTVEMIIATGLRYLAGGKLNDVRHIFSISYTEAHNSVNCFLYAILLQYIQIVFYPFDASL